MGCPVCLCLLVLWRVKAVRHSVRHKEGVGGDGWEERGGSGLLYDWWRLGGFGLPTYPSVPLLSEVSHMNIMAISGNLPPRV